MAPGIHSTNASATQRVDHIDNDGKADGAKHAQQSPKSSASTLAQSVYDAIAAYHPAQLAKQLGSGLPDLASLIDTVRQRFEPVESLLRSQLGQLGGAHGASLRNEAPQNRKRITAVAETAATNGAVTQEQVRSLGQQQGIDAPTLKRLEDASASHGSEDIAQLSGKLTDQALDNLKKASAKEEVNAETAPERRDAAQAKQPPKAEPAPQAGHATETALVLASQKQSQKPLGTASSKPSLKENIDAHLPKFADVFPPPQAGEKELTLEEFKAAFAIYAEISRQVAAFCQELFGSSANAQGANHMPEPAPIDIDGYLRQHADDIKTNASAAQQDGKPASA